MSFKLSGLVKLNGEYVVVPPSMIKKGKEAGFIKKIKDDKHGAYEIIKGIKC